MLHDLIKAANRNLAPGADPEKDWLKYADEPEDDCCLSIEDMNDAEEIDFDPELDEYDECDECSPCESADFVYLETTAEELGYDDTLEYVEDSEVLEDFLGEVISGLGYIVPIEIMREDLSDLDFITFEEHLDGTVTVEVNVASLVDYLENL